MKIKELRVTNFRAYRKEKTILFDNLTTIVGKNDIGKSTLLEALEIFFSDNKGQVKIDKDDINKDALADGDNTIEIAIVLGDLPSELVIDATNPTTLTDEYLLNNNGDLEIIKKYPNAGSQKVFIKASHPTNPQCRELLLKKNSDLKKILPENAHCTDLSKNACIRKAIWDQYIGDLQLEEIEIDASKEDAKKLWDKIKEHMPLYTLFQSDRKNSDGDSLVQDPMKLAVTEILKDQEILNKLDDVATNVKEKLTEVAENTLSKIKEMNPSISETLNPMIPATNDLKCVDVFKNVSITGDDDIPINKRGSGVRRLILLNFFRSQAEKKQQENQQSHTIYAIEEPETSQHQDHQRKLIEALIKLSDSGNTQIILTTHSPAIIKLLSQENKILVINDNDRTIEYIAQNKLIYTSILEACYLAFGESTEEYHISLYGYLEYNRKLSEFRSGKDELDYIKLLKNGERKNKKYTIDEYIRHQIHHPENTINSRYTHEELQQSINNMRKFIREFIQEQD